MEIEDSEGYKKLHQAILNDKNSGRTVDERMKSLHFAVARAKHYEEKTGVPAGDILTKWEEMRNYWYMNYYQEANQPLIKGDYARVFETTEDLAESIGKDGFRCPNCNGVSKNPYRCDSGIKLELLNSNGNKETCNWCVGGLFGALGKGAYVFVKKEMRGESIFRPIAWEAKENNESI